MASTNKTTNYELSQYIGSDKPTYLGDYNSDMLKIDTQMKANNDLATSANAAATTANETAGTALTNANNAQTTANSANTTATSALSKATANEVNIGKFNLTNINTYNNQNAIFSSGWTYGSNYITIATDDTNSVFKLYGAIAITSATAGTNTITMQSSLRPKSEYQIDPTGLWVPNSGKSSRITATIKTNGEIVISCYVPDNSSGLIVLFPCLYFNKDFGDTPQP